MKIIVVIGEGGHSKVIQELITFQFGDKIVGFLDDKYPSLIFKNNKYFGPISAVKELLIYFEQVRFVIAIGNNQVRKKLVKVLDIPPEYYLTLIHHTAYVSPSANIGCGTVILANSVIHTDSKIGSHTIINTGAVIEHDNEINDYVHISPNATLTGTVTIGEGVQIGAGATIIPNRKVGDWSLIGAGATVINDLPAYCTAVGVPAVIKSLKVIEGV